MPALQPYIIEAIWEQFSALLPERKTDHPLGCHRPRIPDRVVFEKLVEVLVFGCAYWRIADEECSATTLRRTRDEWIEAGVMDDLREMALETYDRLLGLELADLDVDCGITKAPLAAARKRVGVRWTEENEASSARWPWTLAASLLGSLSPRPIAMTRRSWPTLSTPYNDWESCPIGRAYISTAPTTPIPPTRGWQLAG